MTKNLELTPTDPETGLVLSVCIQPEDFVISKSRQHHREHPERRGDLGDYAGRVLRISSTQQLPNHMHMSAYEGAYHDIFWGSKESQDDSASKIRKGLLYLAKVIPRQAIVLTGDGYEFKRLNDEEHAFLSHPLVTHIEGNNPRARHLRSINIGHAIVRCALEQNLEDVASERIKQRFLKTLDHQRERELGNLIIFRAIDQLVTPVTETYERARTLGMVDPNALQLRALVRGLVPDTELGSYYEVLRRSLASDARPVTALQTGVNGLELAA